MQTITFCSYRRNNLVSRIPLKKAATAPQSCNSIVFGVVARPNFASSMNSLLVIFILLNAACARAAVDSSDSSSSALAEAKGSLEIQGQVIQGPLNAPDAAVLRSKEAAVTDHGRHTTRGVSFDCSGVQCGGMLYLPKAAAVGGKGSSSSSSKGSTTGSSTSLPPVIVMAHGLGGEKTWLAKFASVFAEAGFAVLTFDYRHWGSSDGQPRQWVSIQKQQADWLSAVKHVQTNMKGVVDGSRLSLWGTSFAGGHVIVIASKLPGQVKAVISNVSVRCSFPEDGPLTQAKAGSCQPQHQHLVQLINRKHCCMRPAVLCHQCTGNPEC